MRIIATHNDEEVVIIQVCYKGNDIKVVYYGKEGAVGTDSIENFVVDDTKARLTET